MLIDGILLNGSVKKAISERLQQRIFLRELDAEGVIHQAENVLYQTKRIIPVQNILHQNKNVPQSKDIIHSTKDVVNNDSILI
jgi:hypothetical protein